jgi:hypothetical protein
MCSDRGPVMVGIVLNQIFRILGVKRVKTTAHHPQSNGVVEIFNKTLKQSLRIWSKENQRDWDELIPFALFAYNTSFHSLLRETPYYLNHGIQAKDITDDLTESDYFKNASIHGYAQQLTERLYKTHYRVRELLEQVNEKREKEIDDEKIISLSIGDQVLLFDPTTPKGVSRKLVRRWIGPFIIIEKHSDVTYTIMKENKQQKVNIQRLRLFKDYSDIDDTIGQQETQLDIARREIDAISEEIKSLQQRNSVITSAHNMKEHEPQTIARDVMEVNVNYLNVGVTHITVLDEITW